MIELTVLLILLLCFIIGIYFFSSNRHEPFVVQRSIQGDYLSACPAGYKTFYNANGDINCCNGDIIANKCVGIQCTLNGKGTHDLPNCVDATLSTNKEKGDQWCPASMSTYFENAASKRKGCTKGKLNATLTGPSTSTQPTCTIYATEQENMNAVDSCFLQKEMEAFVCSDPKQCTKTLVQRTKGAPITVQISMTDSQHNTYVGTTRASLTRFYDATKPNWRETGIDLSKSHLVAEVLQEVYVDHTMDAAEMQMNP